MDRTAAPSRKAAPSTTTDQNKRKRSTGATPASPAAPAQRTLDVVPRAPAPSGPAAAPAPAKKSRQAFDHMHDVKIKVENMHDRTRNLVKRIGAWNMPEMKQVLVALGMADSALENVRNEFAKLPAGLQPKKGKARGVAQVEIKVDMIVSITEKRRSNYEGIAASDLERLTVKWVGEKKLKCRTPGGVEVLVGKRDVMPLKAAA